MSINKPFLLYGVSLLVLAGQAVWAAPSLSVGTVSGKAGSVVVLPIQFEPGSARVASLQFNLTLPKGVSDVSVAEGDTVKAAKKSVTTRRSGNTWKFIIFGLNQDALAAGDLLKAHVKISADVPAGSLKVPLSDAIFTDPQGKSINGSKSSKKGQISVL